MPISISVARQKNIKALNLHNFPNIQTIFAIYIEV
jgi:hypothetical protein